MSHSESAEHPSRRAMVGDRHKSMGPKVKGKTCRDR